MNDEQKLAELTDEELETAAGGVQTYTVKPRDTLVSIAKKFGTTWMKLKECNNILFPWKLTVGQKIKICY